MVLSPVLVIAWGTLFSTCWLNGGTYVYLSSSPHFSSRPRRPFLRWPCERSLFQNACKRRRGFPSGGVFYKRARTRAS